MNPGVVASIRSAREQLRRLSVVFSVEIRLKIVAELYLRPMSPTEFVEKFGGGSVERISGHFAVLEAQGWLRRVGPKPRGSKRPGPDETLYRAVEPAFFDAHTWALLPYGLRLAHSWNSFKATVKEVREGIEGARDGRLGHEPSCLCLDLDSLGWSRVTALLDSGFEAAFEEQIDAKFRVATGKGTLTRYGLFQLGFERPHNGDGAALELIDGPEPLIPFPERMAPVFADDLLMEVLNQLSKQEMGIKRFHREFANGTSEWSVRHRFNRLEELGWIAVARKVKRRAAMEHIYRATRPAVDNDGPWDRVSRSLAEMPAWQQVVRTSDLVKESITAGVFDLRIDRHLSWSIIHLDERGWRNVTAAMARRAVLIGEEQEQAKARIEQGAQPLSMVVALAALESPISSDKAP